MSIRHIVFAGLLATATVAPAVTIFSDNFNSDTGVLNQTTFLGGWTVANGSVDVIGSPPSFNDILPGNGHYVDLDGSTGNAGEFSKALALIGGVTYTASFQLAGSQRGGTEIVDVSFGTSLGTFTPASADSLGTETLVFTPGASGTFLLTFANQGGDNVGSLLDNVQVVDNVTAAVPEPETWALMLAGLGLLGFMARRKQNAA